jgi:predicted nuclease with TOPRIM domain
VDQELKAYLEEMEARTGQRFDRLEARMDERFARVDERFARVDDRFVGLEARMDERFERVETEARHTRVLLEGMHDNIRLLAEGVIGTGERIDALREETTGRLEEIKGSVEMIHQILVPRVQRLENRVKILEDSAERKNRDVLEVIRERFGIRQS